MAVEQIDHVASFTRTESGDLLSLGRGEPLPELGRQAAHELVAEHAAAFPDRIAVECGGESLTYGELDAWAGRIAARLAAAGVGRGGRVGLLAEQSVAMIAGALGILRCGAAYVPVDPSHPPRRLEGVLADAQVSCVVVTAATASLVEGMPEVRAEDDATGPIAPAVAVAADDPAYLIYTSGSTGEPKGVLVRHGNLAASTLARQLVYPGPPVFLLVSPLAFDSSVAGLWGTLTTGGRLVVATADEIRDPEALAGLVHHHQVTRVLCVPGLYRVLLDAADRVGHHRLDSLETVIVAGESLPESLVERHFSLYPRKSLVNEYGPTEATVWASYRRFTGPGPVTIGGPIPGAALYVLDEGQRPVPPGVDGELYVGGAGVAAGYFGKPEATAEAFSADPFTGGRMYRTGDVVRWTADGTLAFQGRRDHQVKIRGHRVELGAVEASLRKLPGVRDAVVMPDETGALLLGFVIAGPDVAGTALRARLAERLPEAMVPTRIEVLDAFPVNANGKTDRAALVSRDSAPAPVETATGEMAKVAAAWAEVLDLDDIPAEVNFFDLGGHSLAMFRLQDALQAHTGSRPSVVALFRHTTVAAQAALIADRGAGAAESSAGVTGAARRAAALHARRMRAERRVAK